MNVKKVLGIMFVLFISLFIVACSNESDNESEGRRHGDLPSERQRAVYPGRDGGPLRGDAAAGGAGAAGDASVGGGGGGAGM